jgi:hypothetical protein
MDQTIIILIKMSVDISIANPIELTKAIEQFSGIKQLCFKMLKVFEGMTLIPRLKEIAEAVDKEDFAGYKAKAHMLKGGSGYIAAGPVHYCCYFIQDNYNSENFDAMIAYYPELIEASIDYIRYSRKIIAEFEG